MDRIKKLNTGEDAAALEEARKRARAAMETIENLKDAASRTESKVVRLDADLGQEKVRQGDSGREIRS